MLPSTCIQLRALLRVACSRTNVLCVALPVQHSGLSRSTETKREQNARHQRSGSSSGHRLDRPNNKYSQTCEMSWWWWQELDDFHVAKIKFRQKVIHCECHAAVAYSMPICVCWSQLLQSHPDKFPESQRGEKTQQTPPLLMWWQLVRGYYEGSLGGRCRYTIHWLLLVAHEQRFLSQGS